MGAAAFTVIAESPGEEFVLGIMGRFWTPTGGVVAATAERFRELPPSGLAQAVWNFRVRSRGVGTELSTETRVRCGDEVTRRQFGRYWRIIRLGSGLIRTACYGIYGRRRSAVPPDPQTAVGPSSAAAARSQGGHKQQSFDE